MSAKPFLPDVAGLLAPRSVAVIGASDKPDNLGADTVRRLLRFNFPGPVWPVNRSREAVAGLPAFAAIADLPGVPDLAIMAIPADGLADAIRDCAAAGVRCGVAYAGGLAESGREEGKALQRHLVALCREVGFTLCGPNCVGFINTAVPVTATFATALHEVEILPAGSISLVSQSGGIATTAMASILQAGFGIRALVSSGNEAVVSFADYIRALANDEGTRVIGCYLEGVPDGADFADALEEACRRGKPVVMIKSGATPASARAALAHTGALVGEDRVFDAVLQEAGIIRVQSIEELVDVCIMLACIPEGRLPRGPGLGIVTFGGGNGVLATDQAAQHGLKTPPLDADAAARLRPLLVSVASAANPLDLTPTTAFRPEALARLPAALDAIGDDPQLHALMFIIASLGSKAREIGDIIIDLHRRFEKTLCVCWASPPSGAIERLAEDGIAAFVEQQRAMRALGRLVARDAALSRPPRPMPAPPELDWNRFAGSGGGIVTEDRCHALLQAAGLPVAPGELATSEAEALRIAGAIGFPVVLKGIGAEVTHRAAAGLLAVDLRTEAELAAAWRSLDARSRALGAAMQGFYVQSMAKGGSELLVTSFRDSLFGPMITVGAGGGLTEAIDDVVTQRAPVSEAGAAAMIARLRTGARLAPRDAVTNHAASFVARFSQLCLGAPWAKFTFEVNPIKWTADGAVAVDGLLIIEDC